MKVYEMATDVTRHIEPRWMAEHNIKTVYQRYIFDDDTRVHCCELTPSYELWTVGYFAEFHLNASEHDIEAFENEAMVWDQGIEYVKRVNMDSDKIAGPWEYDSMDEAIDDAHANPSFC